MTLAGRQFMKQRGVGLIEVILVIAIAGFMIAIAINGISNGGRGNFDDGMNQVLNNFRTVQNEAMSGQGPSSECASPSDADYFFGNCIKPGSELLGKGMSFSTAPDPVDGIDFAVKSINGSYAATAYYEHIVVRGSGGFAGTVDGLKRTQKKFPSAVALSKVEVVPAGDSTNTDRGMVNFTAANSSSKALPFYFNQSIFSDSRVPTSERAYGFTPAATYNKYLSPQTGVVRLSFVSASGAGYKATIEINTATGTMELKE